MSKLVTELHIIGRENNIFDTDIEYTIPLYQRAYAWEDKQLVQLLEDIQDVSEGTNYYIGSLIVSKQSGKYEVVDGQQRLTSLYILLNCLGIKTRPALTFACREKSNYTLRNIEELLLENRSKLDMDRIEFSVQRGVKILSHELGKPGFNKKDFLRKLNKVIVYRIEVPENTDLNRYFEIMNTRGEQLEQHDILKAALMSYLSNDAEKAMFAKIWDACSDMTGYVQMHFISKNNAIREAIFGREWNELPQKSWLKYKNIMKYNEDESTGQCITDIVDKNFKVAEDDGYLDADTRVRFESIIEFPYFLLHTLRVYITLYGVAHKNAAKDITDKLLDDKKLIDAFDRVILYGVKEKGKINENKEKFSREFIMCLLRTRYLFDKYIVKREYTNDSSDGEWSLKSLYVSRNRKQIRPYYKNTRFIEIGQRNTTNDLRIKNNTMIQSALRVSYTSPKVMHWITRLLIWLSEGNCKHTENEYITGFDTIAEDIAIEAVKENFLDTCEKGVYSLGVNTPHIVFNYLDYLLWFYDSEGKYSDFTFEFRNSIEHWYPQNPSEGTFEQWKDGVDRFGNLCIIQRNINSKFSNMSPEAKKSTFKDMISKGSIKLRIMSELTEKKGNKAASLYWKETMCKQHEEEMMNILLEACGIDEQE
jgi:Uncharacterized conserved protein